MKTNFVRRWLAMLTAFMMLVGMMPVSALAEENDNQGSTIPSNDLTSSGVQVVEDPESWPLAGTSCHLIMDDKCLSLQTTQSVKDSHYLGGLKLTKVSDGLYKAREAKDKYTALAVWTFHKADEAGYYTLESDGKYLNIPTSAGAVSVSGNPQPIYVKIQDDGRIRLWSANSTSAMEVNNYGFEQEGKFGTWNIEGKGNTIFRMVAPQEKALTIAYTDSIAESQTVTKQYGQYIGDVSESITFIQGYNFKEVIVGDKTYTASQAKDIQLEVLEDMTVAMVYEADALNNKSVALGVYIKGQYNDYAFLQAEALDASKLKAVRGYEDENGPYAREAVHTWTFIQVGDNQYQIKANNGQYLTITGTGANGSGNISVSASPSTINVEQANGALHLTGADGGSLNLYGNNWASGFGIWNGKISDKNERFYVYESVPQKASWMKDLNGRSVAIGIPNWQGQPRIYVLQDSALNDQKLSAKEVNLNSDGTVFAREGGITKWTFQSVDPENGFYYYIKSGDKYLTITDGGLSVSTTPCVITVDQVQGENYVYFTISSGDKTYALHFNNNVNGGYVSTGYNYNEYKQKLHLYDVSETLTEVQVVFDKNGGSANAPGAIYTTPNSTITLPDYSGTRDGYRFLGWALKNSLNRKYNNDPTNVVKVYKAGTTYEIKEDDVYLYAAWTPTTNANVRFFLRIDGQIPSEPGKFKKEPYAPSNDDSMYDTGMAKRGVLTEQRWVIDLERDGKSIVGNHLDNDVTALLTALPTDEEIASAWPTYDKNAQYVHWYVIKLEDDDWHVDGVVLNRNQASIAYEKNSDDGQVNDMPLGYQRDKNTEIVIGQDEDGVLHTPTRTGYVFKGWSTTPDGKGEFYAQGTSFVLTESITLYARWADGINILTMNKKNEAGTVLEDATFQLEEKLSAGGFGKVDIARTNEAGTCVCENLANNRVYRLTEISAPYGYEKRNSFCFKITSNSAGTMDFIICDENGDAADRPEWLNVEYAPAQTADGQGYLNVSFTMEDEWILREIVFKLQDRDTGNKIAGAQYTLKENDTEITGVLKSNSDGEGIFSENHASLHYGTYTLYEERVQGNNNKYEKENVTFTLGDYVDEENHGLTIDDGNATAYCNKSTQNVKGLTVTTYTYTVILTNSRQASVSGAIVWDDDSNRDGCRPNQITVRLLNGDQKVAEKVLDASKFTGDKWEFTFDDLPYYKNNKKITYTIEEILTEELTAHYTSSTDQNSRTITNTHKIETRDITVNKVWNDNNDEQKIRAASVTLNLLADGNTDPVASATIGEKDGWSYTFKNMPVNVRDGNGTRAIKYGIDEELVDKYMPGTVTENDDGTFTVTNTPATRSLTLSKMWSDGNNRDGLRPDHITIRVYKKGGSEPVRVETFEGSTEPENIANTWPIDIVGLPKYENGEEIIYEYFEEPIEGYQTNYTGSVIENCHTPDKVSINGTKTWFDVDEKDRPDSITLILKADEVEKKRLTLNKTDYNGDTWEYSFGDWYKNENLNGTVHEIEYTVEEEPVSGYITKNSEGNDIVNIRDKVVVTITGNNNTETYDGTEKTANGYTFTIDNPKYTENDFRYDGEAGVSAVEAGTYPMGLKQENFHNLNDDFTNVEFRVTDGTLLIKAKEVLYNYITFDGGQTYLSLGTSEIIANRSSAEYMAEGTERIEEGEYQAVAYDLNGVSWYKTVQGENRPYNPGRISYVNANVAKEGQPSYTAEPEFVGVRNGAPFVTGTMEPAVDRYNVNDNTAVFYRYYKATLSGIPITNGQPLLTEIEFNKKYYGVEWSDNFAAIDSRLIPFGHDLTEGEYDPSLKDYDFSNLVLTDADGITYVYVNSQAYKDDPSLPYYTVGTKPIRKVNHVRADGLITEQAKENWKDLKGNPTSNPGGTGSLSSWTKAGTDGYPYVAGYYHRDYQAILHVAKHKVTFVNEDGTVLKAATEYKHTTPATKVKVPDTTPTKAADENYSYIFNGWNKQITDVTEDAVYQATYRISEAGYVIHHYLDGTDIKVADDETGKMAIGKALKAEKSRNLYSGYADIATVSRFSKGNGTVTTSEDLTNNEITVYYKVPLTIRAESAEKPYDGTALTENSFTVTGLVNGDTADKITAVMTAESTITNAGEKNNVIASYTAPGYYKVRTENGVLKVSRINAVVTITENSNKVKYNGQKQSVTGYTATVAPELSHLYDVEHDFTFNDPVGADTASGTDAGTYNMQLRSADFTNTNENFDTVTFNIVDGFLVIEPIQVEVTINGAHNTTVYDGQEHTVAGYTAEADSTLYDVNADFTFNGTAEAKRTEEGTTNMGLEGTQFTNTNTNFAPVTFTVNDGWQKITPVNEVVVTITGHTAVADYDGEEHNIGGYDVEISNPLYTEDDFTFSGTAEAVRTDAGTTNMGLNETQFVNTSSNFSKVTFEVTDGWQKVNPIDVTVEIAGHTDTTDYDGEEHTASGYEVTRISSPLYTAEDFTFSGTAEAVRTAAGTTNMNLAETQFANTNDNFRTVTFDITDGWQKINPIDVTVTITGHNDAVDYDGEEHTASGYDVTSISSPLYTENDFTFSGTAEAVRTAAGTTNMGLKKEQFTNDNDNFGTVTFDITDGYQTINPIDVTVTITENGDELDYDGAVHTVTGYTAEADSELYDVDNDFTFSGTASVSGTNAGSYDMELKPEDFTNTNGNFRNVTFEIEDGQLVIKPITAEVTITGNHNTAAYDGQEHTVTGYTADTENDLYDVTKDFTFSGTAEAAQTNEGTAYMGLEETQFVNTNENFSEVKFNITDGYQTITPVEEVVVTITGHTAENAYDGEEHSIDGYEVEISNPLYTEDDFTFSGTAEAKQTNVGTAYMGLEDSQFENLSDNFSIVTFVVKDGWQKIKPIDATVTITGHTDTVGYDGEEHSVSGYEVTNISSPLYTAADFTFSGTAEAKRTAAGTTNMNLAETQFVNTNENFGTVTFNVTDGSLTVNPIEATVAIAENSANVTYNGAEQSVTGYTVKGISTPLYSVENFTFGGNATAAGTDVGTYEMTLKPEDFTNNNANFSNVTFVITDGTLVVNPAEATVITEGAEKTYDGTALTKDEVRIEGLAGTDSVQLTAVGTQTEVGSSYNTYSINWNNAKETNYIVKDRLGILTVNPIENPLITVSGTNTWNDEENADGLRPESITVNLLADGQEIDSRVVTAADGWSYSFPNLPTYVNNREVVYSITEDAVPGYTSTVDGYNLTNTHQRALITVSGTKYWADDNNASGSRPDSIRVNLLANGTQIRTAEVTGEGDTWTYRFTNLPEYENSRKVTYTVTEEEVAGYETSVVGYNIYNVLPKVDEVQSFTLTVHYWANGAKAFADSKHTYAYGDTYNVTSPTLAGYTADKTSVQGVISEDTEIDVYYTPITVNLTVYYRYLDGTTAAGTYKQTLTSGEAYSVASPEITGYKPNESTVSGTAGARDIEVVVLYTAKDTDNTRVDPKVPQPGKVYTVIGEYKTALGVGGTYTGHGDSIE